ncbi:TetR/AcrR family transcriptional regulator [Nocardioides sp.]|uniref:TetR/AcrR family transcriptional regulator n=1 Tax=Nocardioides sp. TaxID=35761 RepID=UPI003D13AEDA
MAIRASTEARLLDAADELLFDRGVVATPVDAILERAGVSPATLYRSYASKEALVAATLDRRQRDWLEAWDEAVARAPDDLSRLLALFDALDYFTSRPHAARWCAFLGTSAEYAEAPPVLAAAIQRDTDDLRTRLTALAEPLAGPGAAELAEEILLVFSGQLAMRLRSDGPTDTSLARRIAEAVAARASTGWSPRPGADAEG